MSKSSVISPAPPATPAPRSGAPFVDIETLRNSDGITGIISQRRRGGELTCGIFRIIENDGELTKTTFVPERLMDRFREMVEMLQKRCAELRAGIGLPTELGGKLPFPIRSR
jgi:hypothetical protein